MTAIAAQREKRSIKENMAGSASFIIGFYFNTSARESWNSVNHLEYLAVIAFVSLCAFGVNLGFRLRILRRWRELFLTQLSIVVIYLTWDTWAIAHKNWFFDTHQIINVDVLPKVPLEELLFFIVVPLTVLLSYQALLKLTGWQQDGESQ